MKIGDEVYIHGYVDEIRKDTVIIRNDGGYFGTVKNEVVFGEMSERKKGKWVFIGEEGGNAFYSCSVCGKSEVHAPIVQVAYCWNCGADMKGE